MKLVNGEEIENFDSNFEFGRNFQNEFESKMRDKNY